MNMAITSLDPVEQRILGCLIEKQRTTPDTYPLTLNALRLACNQSTNRDPVVDYDEMQIQETLQRMHRRELTRVASGHGSRSSKYRHLVSETIGLDDAGQALLCVLLLRGPQTPGELKTRTERLHPFESLGEIELALQHMIEGGFVELLERRPGEKQVRYRHLLGDIDGDVENVAVESAGAALNGESLDLVAELADLKRRVEELERRL
jgi:uncharacterized protein YceH (UPF0502 family)